MPRTVSRGKSILAVGNSPGQMDFTNTLTLAGSTIMEIDGTAGAGVTGGHDFINLTGAGAAGALTTGGTLSLDMGMIFAAGTYSWNLFDMASETGAFSAVTLTDKYSGSLVNSSGVWDLTSGINTWQFTDSTGVLGLTVIPEPSSALLVCLGGLALVRRRRQVCHRTCSRLIVPGVFPVKRLTKRQTSSLPENPQSKASASSVTSLLRSRSQT